MASETKWSPARAAAELGLSTALQAVIDVDQKGGDRWEALQDLQAAAGKLAAVLHEEAGTPAECSTEGGSAC